MKSNIVISNIICSGFVALFISWFFAEGALGDADALTPEFFLILPLWIIGVVLMYRFVSKTKLENTSYLKIVLSNSFVWLTIPLGLIVAIQFI